MREKTTNRRRSSTALKVSSPTKFFTSQKASSRLVVKLVILLSFALILLSKPASAAWTNSSFDRCMNITITNSGSETLTNFPAYINISHDEDMLPDFKDLRFYNSSCNNDGTIMDYEIENYTSTNAHVWVRIPSLPSTGTIISVYYKNNTAIENGQNASGVWDSDYIMVQHFEESCSTANCTIDSTRYQNNLTPSGNLFNATGRIGPAYSFDGTSNYATRSYAPTLNITGPITICAWVKYRTTSDWSEFVSFGDGSNQFPYIYGAIGYGGSGLTPHMWWYNNPNAEYFTNNANPILPDSWEYICAVRNTDSNATQYVNGTYVPVDNVEGATIPSVPTGTLYIGEATSGTYLFTGSLDELRISDTNRSANWINLSYLIVNNQSQYVSFGVEQSQSVASSGTSVGTCRDLNESNTTYQLNQSISSDSGVCFNITASNVTLDGNGFSLAYGVLFNNSNAIVANGYNSITIKNIKINQTNTTRVNSTAIIITNSQGNRIDNISLLIYGKVNSPYAFNYGIFLNNTQNSNITNSNITVRACDRCPAILLFSGSNNTFIANNNITVTGRYSCNIFSNNSNQHTIYSNNIINSGYAGGYPGYGVYLLNSDNSIINQTFFDTTGTGTYSVYIDTNADDNIITNCNIDTSVYTTINIDTNSDNTQITYTNITSTSYRPIYMITTSHGTYINHCIIWCDYECVYGASAPTNNVRIENSNITMNATASINCVIAIAGNNWTINNTNMTAPSTWRGCGIYFSSADELGNITIANSRIQTDGYDSAWGLRILGDGVSTISIKDSIINASNYTDIYFSQSDRTLNLTNVTFTDAVWGFNSYGIINRFWYLDAYVNDTAGNIVENANVTGFDKSLNQAFTNMTDINGRISRQTLLAYTQNSNSNVTYIYPYAINTSASSYYTDSRSIDLDGNQDIVITLTNASLPDITILSPIDGRTYSSTTVLINITNSSNTNAVWYKWNNTNYTYTGSVNFDFKIEGAHNLTAYANNSLGISSETVFFTISLGYVNVSDCQDLDSPNIIYQLTQNITSASGTCFEIKADNVTLDGQGYTLTYANSGGGKAVHLDGYDEATIKNLIIKQTNAARTNSPAITLENSQDHNITNNTLDILGETYTYGGYNNGIYAYNTTGTSISQNNINTDCGYCEAISLEYGSDNAIISSNIITVRQDYSPGILSNNSNNHIIYNNTINDYAGLNGHGIYLFNSDFSLINQSTITVTTSGSKGILLEYNSDSNVITNTAITSSVAYGGIYIDSYCDYNNITYANISLPSVQYGIYISGPTSPHNKGSYIDHVNINCSTICMQLGYIDEGVINNANIYSTTSGSGNIYISNSDNWIINNSIVSGYGRGIYASSINSLSIANTNITVDGTTNGEAFYSGSSTGTITIRDSILNSLQRNDSYFSGGSASVNFTNVSFTDKHWSSNGQTLNVFWYLDVYVNDSLGIPLPSANITGWDNNSNQRFTGLTDGGGWIRHEAQQYYQTNNTILIGYNNYTVNASKQTYTTNSSQLNITTNSVLYFILTGSDTTPPTVYINVSLNNTFIANSTPSIDFNFSDSQSIAAECRLYFNGTLYDTEIGVQNNTQTTLTAESSLSTGNYSVYINCTDNGGNIGKSAILNIMVVNNYINITLEMNPNPASPSENVSIYGHLNHSTGIDISHNTVYIYINDSLHYYNNNTGMLENSSPWWDNSYNYRTKINITSMVATSLNDSIAIVNISTDGLITASKMKSDCGDTRFTDSNGNELQYTLETSTCNSANTIYWVWANLTGNTGSAIFAYYENNASTLKTDYVNPDSGLILYLHFDNSSAYGENGSSNVYDFSKNNNNGTPVNSPKYISGGRFGGSYNYTTGSDYMRLNSVADDIPASGSITFTAWVKLDNFSAEDQYFFATNQAGTGTANYLLMGAQVTTRNFQIYGSAACNPGSFSFTQGEWAFVAVIANQSNTQAYSYANGNYLGNCSYVAIPTTARVSLAQEFDGATVSNEWGGAIDEVRIYNRALTNDEILFLYNSTASRYIENHSFPTTDTNGNYNYTWSTSTEGNYSIKVNTTYLGLYAEANGILTVQEAVAGTGVNCTGYKCLIIKGNGNAVAIFDALGAVDLKAALTQSAAGIPGANDFIIRNSTGSAVAWINSSGNLLIKGALSENNGIPCTPPTGSFFINGNNSECVAYFNNTGDLWLKGDLRENVLSAWANSYFDRCMNIAINNSGSETLTDFPAYINLSYDSDMLSDFKDIRFYSAECNNGGSPLDYEIENYTASKADIWLRIPSLPSTGTTISVYYKNNTAIESGQNPSGVWDSNYIGVWHMQKINATDSTANQLNCTAKTTTAITLNNSGVVDGTLEFDGTDNIDSLNCSNNTLFNPANITIEAWVKLKGNQASGDYNTILRKPNQYDLYQTPTTTEVTLVIYDNDTGHITYTFTSGSGLSSNAWNYLAATVNPSIRALYVNGTLTSLDDENPFTPLKATSSLLGIGGDPIAGFYEFNGTIDEVRLSSATRSANWINQTYLMINNQINYVTFGSEIYP